MIKLKMNVDGEKIEHVFRTKPEALEFAGQFITRYRKEYRTFYLRIVDSDGRSFFEYHFYGRRPGDDPSRYLRT